MREYLFPHFGISIPLECRGCTLHFRNIYKKESQKNALYSLPHLADWNLDFGQRLLQPLVSHGTEVHFLIWDFGFWGIPIRPFWIFPWDVAYCMFPTLAWTSVSLLNAQYFCDRDHSSAARFFDIPTRFTIAKLRQFCLTKICNNFVLLLFPKLQHCEWI